MIYVFFNSVRCEKSEQPPIRYQDPEDWIFNPVISDISIVLRETTLTISDFIQIGSPVESKQ